MAPKPKKPAPKPADEAPPDPASRIPDEVHERARAIARQLFKRNLELVGRKP